MTKHIAVGQTGEHLAALSRMRRYIHWHEDIAKYIVKTLYDSILKLPVQEGKATTTYITSPLSLCLNRVGKEKKTPQQRAHGILSREKLSTHLESFCGGMWTDRAGVRNHEDARMHAHACTHTSRLCLSGREPI